MGRPKKISDNISKVSKKVDRPEEVKSNINGEPFVPEETILEQKK